ncbi:MAG: hypothetical protein V3U80_03395 [Flavobacteriaceae bacterium]
MENVKYFKLIDKIKATIAKDGVDSKSVVSDLKDLRVMVVEENQPLLAKVIRLTFQHIEANKTFNVAIPDDEPFEDENGEVQEFEAAEIVPVESLDYLLSNMTGMTKAMNISDVRAFVVDLKEQAGEDY